MRVLSQPFYQSPSPGLSEYFNCTEGAEISELGIRTGKPWCCLDAIEADTLNLCEPETWTSITRALALDDMVTQKSETI